jgi:hypothetical protein
VVPLAETPTLFAMALALWAVARFHARPGWSNALLFTFAVTWSALLRPDGALLGVALAPAMIVGLKQEGMARKKLVRLGLVCAVLVLLPFSVWTWRNWRVFHVFEPLAPRLATDPGEDPHPGWESWVKTWCLDFVSTSDIYWNEPDDPLDLSKLPGRAVDSPAEYAETAALIADYNSHGYEITPEMDARFARLAEERTAAHPLRSYVWLPLGRLADMTLRPRVENLPIDLDWWVYAHHRAETRFSWAYAGLNAGYLLLGLAGVWVCLRSAAHGSWASGICLGMVAYMAMRSALLLTVEAPEARYTLEFFPMLFALGGMALYRLRYVVPESVLKLKASAGRG